MYAKILPKSSPRKRTRIMWRSSVESSKGERRSCAKRRQFKHKNNLACGDSSAYDDRTNEQWCVVRDACKQDVPIPCVRFHRYGRMGATDAASGENARRDWPMKGLIFAVILGASIFLFVFASEKDTDRDAQFDCVVMSIANDRAYGLSNQQAWRIYGSACEEAGNPRNGI